LLSKPAILQTSPTTKEILIGSADNSIYCLDLEDGEELWSYETDFWVACTPAIEKGKEHTYAIVGSYDSNVYVFDAVGNYELDVIPGLGGVVNQGMFQTSSMGSDAGKDKGKVLSQFHTKDFVVGCTVLVATDEVIAVTKKGKIYNLKLT
jgi:outer membrane protein assembly factor BamB